MNSMHSEDESIIKTSQTPYFFFISLRSYFIIFLLHYFLHYFFISLLSYIFIFLYLYFFISLLSYIFTFLFLYFLISLILLHPLYARQPIHEEHVLLLHTKVLRDHHPLDNHQ